MDIRTLLPEDSEGRLRIIQETVPGKQISLAHIIRAPRPVIYKKLGLNPEIDFDKSAIGILNITPPETVIIASDIAIKAGDIYLGFIDRFSGTLIITGRLSEVESALKDIIYYFKHDLGFAVCELTSR